MTKILFVLRDDVYKICSHAGRDFIGPRQQDKTKKRSDRQYFDGPTVRVCPTVEKVWVVVCERSPSKTSLTPSTKPFDDGQSFLSTINSFSKSNSYHSESFFRLQQNQVR